MPQYAPTRRASHGHGLILRRLNSIDSKNCVVCEFFMIYFHSLTGHKERFCVAVAVKYRSLSNQGNIIKLDITITDELKNFYKLEIIIRQENRYMRNE